MKLIREQVMISTNLDSQGDKLTREELQQLFDSTPTEVLLGVGHDSSLPPMGRGFNKKIKQLDDGEYAIVMDIEIWDEERFGGFGGFSASFRGKAYTTRPESPADVEILLNPIHYLESEFLDLIQFSTETFNINTVVLKQKAAEPMAVIILSFIALAVAEGFFGEIGSEAYSALRKKLSSLPFNTKSGVRGAIHIHAPFEKWDRSYQVVLEIESVDPAECEQKIINLQTARKFIDEKIGDSTGLSKIIIRATEEPPYWVVKNFVDTNGRVVEF